MNKYAMRPPVFTFYDVSHVMEILGDTLTNDERNKIIRYSEYLLSKRQSNTNLVYLDLNDKEVAQLLLYLSGMNLFKFSDFYVDGDSLYLIRTLSNATRDGLPGRYSSEIVVNEFLFVKYLSDNNVRVVEAPKKHN